MKDSRSFDETTLDYAMEPQSNLYFFARRRWPGVSSASANRLSLQCQPMGVPAQRGSGSEWPSCSEYSIPALLWQKSRREPARSRKMLAAIPGRLGSTAKANKEILMARVVSRVRRWLRTRFTKTSRVYFMAPLPNAIARTTGVMKKAQFVDFRYCANESD